MQKCFLISCSCGVTPPPLIASTTQKDCVIFVCLLVCLNPPAWRAAAGLRCTPSGWNTAGGERRGQRSN